MLDFTYFDKDVFKGKYTEQHNAQWLIDNPVGTVSNPITLVGGVTNPVPIVLQDLVVNVSERVVSNNLVYTAQNPDAFSWNNPVLWFGKAVPGTYLQYQIPDTSYQMAMVGFKTSEQLGEWRTFDIAVWNDAWNHFCFIDGKENIVYTTVQYTPGDYVKLSRMGGTFKVEKSSDQKNWVAVHDFSYQFGGDMYPVSDIRGDGKLLNPKSFNLV